MQFYEKLGFNHSLTDFPAPAFQENVVISGLRHEPPLLVKEYGSPVPPAEEDREEEALVRTNLAHDWLQRLESNLRRFIDNEMTAVFGTDWPKHRLPNGLYEQWTEKRNKHIKSGREPRKLICYADFSDYIRVICRKDNWREVFCRAFIRKEGIEESFRRLYLIRLDTMHARCISQDDELLLYVEVNRLTRVIQ